MAFNAVYPLPVQSTQSISSSGTSTNIWVDTTAYNVSVVNIQVDNADSANIAFIAWNIAGSATAKTTNSIPVLPNSTKTIQVNSSPANFDSNIGVASICVSGKTATVYITPIA